MKKLVNLKEVMLVLLSVILITVSTTVFATDIVLGDNTAQTVTGNEYDNAQTVPQGNNATTNTANTLGNNATSGNNNARTYNTNSTSDLPQTGIEDYNVGILLVICVASAIFAYKKINKYKNV